MGRKGSGGECPCSLAGRREGILGPLQDYQCSDRKDLLSSLSREFLGITTNTIHGLSTSQECHIGRVGLAVEGKYK